MIKGFFNCNSLYLFNISRHFIGIQSHVTGRTKCTVFLGINTIFQPLREYLDFHSIIMKKSTYDEINMIQSNKLFKSFKFSYVRKQIKIYACITFEIMKEKRTLNIESRRLI